MTLIRLAHEADAAAISAVHVATWQAAYRGLLPDAYLDTLDPDRWRAGWEGVLAASDRPRAGTLVAGHRPEVVVGFVDVQPTRDRDADPASVGEITSIYVRPDAWGAGIGRQLLSAAEETLRAHGFEYASLWVLQGNVRARHFYERAGWSMDGATKDDVIASSRVTEVRYRRHL